VPVWEKDANYHTDAQVNRRLGANTTIPGSGSYRHETVTTADARGVQTCSPKLRPPIAARVMERFGIRWPTALS
jgi:hypothetical protein